MPTCSYCGKLAPIGNGLRLFKKDGTSHYYCSRKCIRNHDMGRNPRKMKWTREPTVKKAKAESPAALGKTHPADASNKPKK